jgi:hypothetical protein
LAGFAARTLPGAHAVILDHEHDLRANAFRGCREGKPVPTPHQVRGRLFPDHAPAERAMKKPKISRRDVLKGSTALAFGTIFASPARAEAPPPVAITPELIEAAKKEAKVVLYSAMDLPVGEKLGKAFEAAYPGIQVQIERSGSERLFQRIDQEFSSNIHAADVITSSDASHFIPWKKNGWLAPFVSEDIAKYFPQAYRDPDGMFATSRLYMSSIAYNTSLVKPEDAPKSFADLLDPKWAGKMVKGHPAYSGTIMTATFQMVRELGWGYFEKLSKQRVMQVQSSTDGRRQRLWRRALEGGGPAGRAGLSRRGRADDLGTDRHLRDRAASQRRKIVPGLAAHAGDPAILRRLHRAIFGSCAGAVQARTPQDFRHQADEGGPRRRRRDG